MLQEKNDAHNLSPKKEAPPANQQGAGIALMVMSDLIGGLFVGGALGFLAHYFFKTPSFVFAIFIFLGGISGLVNIFRYVAKEQKK